jgi:hypothetical protein
MTQPDCPNDATSTIAKQLRRTDSGRWFCLPNQPLTFGPVKCRLGIGFGQPLPAISGGEGKVSPGESQGCRCRPAKAIDIVPLNLTLQPIRQHRGALPAATSHVRCCPWRTQFAGIGRSRRVAKNRCGLGARTRSGKVNVGLHDGRREKPALRTVVVARQHAVTHTGRRSRYRLACARMRLVTSEAWRIFLCQRVIKTAPVNRLPEPAACPTLDLHRAARADGRWPMPRHAGRCRNPTLPGPFSLAPYPSPSARSGYETAKESGQTTAPYRSGPPCPPEKNLTR